MTPSQLERAGRTLYGDNWQTPLALALGVSDRSMRRWASGSHPIPATLAGEIERLTRAADAATAVVRERLDKTFRARVVRD